jgi:hypothetical protein
MPQLYNPKKGNGLFCGHDWTSSRFPAGLNEQAYQYVEKIGQYFKENDYQGIFGLDFILDEKTNQLYISECNPRLVGSFPILSMSQALNNEVSILACHVLDGRAAPDYQIDIEAVNQSIRQEKTGGQMILHNLTDHWARNHRQLKAGVYKLEKNKLKYLRAGYHLKHLKGKEEFLLADGVPLKRAHFSPNRRLCRILTLNKTLDVDKKQLTPWASRVAQRVYRAFDLRPVKWIKTKKIFKPHFLAKG